MALIGSPPGANPPPSDPVANQRASAQLSVTLNARERAQLRELARQHPRSALVAKLLAAVK